MENLTRYTRRQLLGLALLVALAASACGPQVITGRPPFIGIAAMTLAGNALSTQFRVANQNGVPMTLQDVDITVTLGESELVRENRPMSLLIDANSAEEVTVEKLPDEYIRRQLASLENGEVVSLPFALTGRVRTEEDGYLRFEQKGHLYPVPGRPGQFRSAVTQAQDLRREEQL